MSYGAEMSSKNQARPEVARKWLTLIHAPRVLKAWREGSDLSPSGAASKFGLDLPTYSAFESGRKRPGIDIATKIQIATDGRVQVTQWAVPHEARKGTPTRPARAS